LFTLQKRTLNRNKAPPVKRPLTLLKLPLL